MDVFTFIWDFLQQDNIHGGSSTIIVERITEDDEVRLTEGGEIRILE